jgi:subtilisin family serine protease
MAPRARVAMYKICWSYNGGFRVPGGIANGCFTSDSLAGIEAAVADGVDVLNYSISGGTSPRDPVEQAFRHAVEAGVFVAAAAGNAGPDNERDLPVNHISPWMTTVAASTHDRAHKATLTLGNGKQYQGASLSLAALPSAPMIRGEDAARPGTSPYDASLCYGPNYTGTDQSSLDPAKVSGKIVTCVRGGSPRTDKSQAVKEAGGVGMVLIDDGSGQVLEVHAVPSVHVDAAPGAEIMGYAADAGATAALSASSMVPVTGPVLADFSSRGPNAFDPGVLKPDLSAPGVDILAGVAPSLSAAQHDAIIAGDGAAISISTFMSGTSMATPHVAGLAALLKQRHPGWSPAAVKSALMTSTRSVLPTALTGDQDGSLPWGQGAGLVVPNVGADPGLVYDVGAADYQKYMCGVTAEASDCGSGALTGVALNLASITLPGVVGNQTVRRSVTNVGDRSAIYNASAAIDGFSTTVTPATLTLAPGETQSYSVKLDRTDAADGEWHFGELVWSDGEHKVRSPLQARYNSGVDVAALLSANSVSGTRQLDVATGCNGVMGAVKAGMREYVRLAQTVTQAAPGTFDTLQGAVDACVARGPGVKAVSLGIPNHTMIARFELSNRDTAGGDADDLDLLLLNTNNDPIAYSAHEGSNESVTFMTPPMAVVKVCVLGFKLKNGVSTNYTLSYATAIPNDTKGNLKLTLPGPVTQGGSAKVGVSWSGLEQGKRYLGGMQLLNPAGGIPSFTEFNIDTRDVAPAANASAGKQLKAVQ